MKEVSYYRITGLFRGKKTSFTESRIERARELYEANNFDLLWEVYRDGKRKLIERRAK